MRTAGVTRVMPREVYRHLLMQPGGKWQWDAQPNPELQISDLDSNAIMGVVRIGVSCGRLPEQTAFLQLPEILEKFNLQRSGVLCNAAAVLFGHNLDMVYPQCLLRMARFRGTTREEFFDNQRVHGNVFQLLDAAMSFFFKHLSLSGKVVGLYRQERLTIPYKALRECCINAFCHRSYLLPGGSTGIAIYDDRVEIENIGAFPPQITPDTLFTQHNSVPANPLIADVLYKSGLLENWGRGIALIIDECREAKIPDPEFHSNGNLVRVVFRYQRIVAGAGSASSADHQLAQLLPEQYAIHRRIRLVVVAVGHSQVSARGLMAKMGLRDRKNFISNYLRPAMAAGIIEATYKENCNHPKQQYQLTSRGAALLKSIEADSGSAD